MTNVVDEIKDNFVYLDKAVSTFDPRYTLRVLRKLPNVRKKLTDGDFASIILSTYGANGNGAQLLKILCGGKEAARISKESTDLPEVTSPPSPQVDIYVRLLLQAWLLHKDDPEAAARLFELSQMTTKLMQQYNLRSLDYMSAKVWFYCVRAAERTGQLDQLHGELMSGLRTATLRLDTELMGMLIVLNLQALVGTGKISQAANLVSKTSFPDGASNALAARYYYMLSRINAIQLNYSTAHAQITAAVRKAPQLAATVGFRQASAKLNVLIELLMGDIPDRQTFKTPEFRGPLSPYLALTRAARAGDVTLFDKYLEEHASALRRDGNLSLAKRLRQNVIRTGIRILSLTYSRISLKDMCLKLCIDSEESAEYIVAKAIKDGVIEAEINHQLGFMKSKETLDIYSMADPQYVFYDRINFCMGLHDDCVKAMRYMSNDHRADLKDAEEAREREKELVTEIQEGTDLEEDEDFDI